MPGWVGTGVDEYLRRLPADFKVEFEEVPLGSKTAGGDVKKAQAKEEAAILARLTGKEKVIALDVQGRAWSSEDLSRQVENWRMEGRDLALLIGGPDGLTAKCLALAEQRWSLSSLTLPHPLVRVLVAEQLYRAWSLLSGHPYHR